MPIERGKTFVLKIGDGVDPETFATVGKMRSNGFSGSRDTIDITNKDSPNWNERIPNLFKSLSLSASGLWDGGTQQLAVRDSWLNDNDAAHSFQMVGDSGDTWEGPFIITQFDNDGEHNGERTWSVTLESAGAVPVTDV